ncbi:MAG: TetR family transcriptional regulator [Streptosporangiaceae bacterium]
MPRESRPAASLRERQKAKTRAAIQHEALRLFREQGYEATTIEQIAAAAEVAPSTCFRYFPAKEDLVLTDDYDPLLIEAFRAQSPGLGPVEGVRRALREVLGGLTADEVADMRERAQLALAVPELRAAILDQFAQTIRQIADLVARQTGRPGDDFAVHNLAGAILGVMISAEFYWVEHPDSDLVALLDDALAHLQSGLPL